MAVQGMIQHIRIFMWHRSMSDVGAHYKEAPLLHEKLQWDTALLSKSSVSIGHKSALSLGVDGSKRQETPWTNLHWTASEPSQWFRAALFSIHYIDELVGIPSQMLYFNWVISEEEDWRSCGVILQIHTPLLYVIATEEYTVYGRQEHNCNSLWFCFPS